MSGEKYTDLMTADDSYIHVASTALTSNKLLIILGASLHALRPP